MAKKHFYLKEGVVLSSKFANNPDKTDSYTVTKNDSKIRFSSEKIQYHTHPAPSYALRIASRNSDWYEVFYIDDFANDTIPVKLPVVNSEFKNMATKDSEWIFDRDFVMDGYVLRHQDIITIPAGTKFKIVQNKKADWYYPICDRVNQYNPNAYKCVVCEHIPDIPFIGTQILYNENQPRFSYLPFSEVSNYVSLISNGNQKIYWKIENNKGVSFTPKRYQTLNDIKSSMRVRFSSLSGPDVPEWIEGEYTEKPNVTEGIKAVQYDYASNTVMSSEDLTDYVTELIFNRVISK